MNRKITTTLICFIALLLTQTESRGQINLLKDYQNTSSATIGTFQGINFREAGFSGLYPIPGTNGTEFWTLSDRGVNVDCGNANPSTCRPTYDKMYAFPSYAPKIQRIRVTGTSVQILQTITVKRPNGTTASGIINPTGLGSTAAEVASTDTVLNCANFNLKTTPKDTFGIDPEGIVVDKDGNFWICEEGGATIWKLNSNGVLIKRYTPYANLPGVQPVDVQIDTVFKYRKNNRGFEGIALAPNGKIYAIIQSPVLYPTQAVGEGTRIHRILEIDPNTNAQRMMVYLNDGIIGASGANQIRLRDWKIGDMAAVNDSTFLVLEAAARGTSDIKRLYLININQATAVHSGLYGGLTLEALVDSTGLAGNGIKAVKKTLVMDLLANGWPAVLDKAEGLAILNDSTIAICNDNDFAQTSPNQDGLATATGNLSHVFVYGLIGSNKLVNYKAAPALLTPQGQTGLSSSQAPYLLSATPGVKFTSIISVLDSTSAGYKMAGLADGLGAFDNGDGTFTLLVNHEMGNTVGVKRAHGATGAFVSKWIIKKSDLSVMSGSDLINKVNLWNGAGYTLYNPADTTSKKAFARFCAADLPEVSAFYNSATGKGTQERIFMNGEESGLEGRAFGHIATGTNAGTTYELPYLGKAAWENAVASPASKDTTVVALMDDGTDGQVYFYVGSKTTTGTEIDKAGLSNGRSYGVKITGFTKERTNSTTISNPPAAGTSFALIDLGSVQNMTGAAFNTASNTAGVTSFSRPEDGGWDPSNPNDFYFLTTDQIDQVSDGTGTQVGRSRVWRLHFNDITKPSLGGTVEAVIDGTEGVNMLDNMTIDNYGHIILQEDVGNNAHNGKIWQYTIATDKLIMLAKHDPARFGDIGLAATLPFNADEESSGVIDMQSILGPGHFILADQAHYAIPGAAVEGGQLLYMYNPYTANSFAGAAPSSSQSPYLLPTATGVTFNSILTVLDSTSTGYKMAGLADGLGAFDNGDGTFTLLMNHELGNTVGVKRAHGATGAFVSKWVIKKSDLSVVSGSDLIKNVKLWSAGAYTTYTPTDTTSKKAFARFCAADLPEVSAFYNSATGKGTQERIFMNGEESGLEGRAFGHIATGTNAGTTYELPYLGKAAWENAVASPASKDTTVVALMDDGTDGQVYFYVGAKNNIGNEIERAGLSGGRPYGVTVAGFSKERTSSSVINNPPAPGTRFTMTNVGSVENMTGAAFNTASNNAGVTSFSRPEDGAWDPSSPNDFYFLTTDQIDQVSDGVGTQVGRSRMWRLRFDDITKPSQGGTVEAVIDGTEGVNMLDNMTIDNYGHIILQEDVGNNAHNGKVWQYTIATDALKLIGKHDPARFGDIGVAATAPYNADEESSGVIDMQGILGPGHFILADQAHYAIPGAAVEGGQLLKMYNPDTYNSNPEVAVSGNSLNIPDGSTSATVSNNTGFGVVGISSPKTQVFTISNAGPGALTVTGISFSGANAGEFALTGSITFPLIIAANNSQNINVKFAPLAPGTRTATIKVASNDFDEAAYDFVLQGTAVTCEVNVLGNSLSIADGDALPGSADNTDFGSVRSATGSVNKTFTIQNTGADTLKVTAITFSGSNAGEFTLAGAPAFPWNIAGNGSQLVTVKFAPMADGSRSAIININNNDLDEAPYNFAIGGTGVSPEIDVKGNGLGITDGDVTPDVNDNTDFGGTGTGKTQNRTFVIENTGTDVLSITGINFSGTNASEFTLVSAPGFPININVAASQSVTVKFAPLALGTRTATMSVVNNDPNEGTFDFSLKGLGVDPNSVADVKAVSFVKVYPNPANETVKVALKLENGQTVDIRMIDLQGREVLATAGKNLAAGRHELVLNVADLANGFYFVHVRSGNETSVIKAVVTH